MGITATDILKTNVGVTLTWEQVRLGYWRDASEKFELLLDRALDCWVLMFDSRIVQVGGPSQGRALAEKAANVLEQIKRVLLTLGGQPLDQCAGKLGPYWLALDRLAGPQVQGG